jgi:2-polyprenyl-3-methyl-5-hydroxy-6-metoxy-1,4-benzoquinol methylase
MPRVMLSEAPGVEMEVCPVCHSGDIAAWMNVGDNGHLRRQDVRLPVWRCDSCDVAFLNPPPDPALGAEYFAQTYRQTGNLYYSDAFKAKVSEIRLSVIERAGAPGKRLLDVGCGKGAFVHLATRLGWQAWGVEFDAGAVQQARSRGLKVLVGSMEHTTLPTTFDVITLWDVIEHVTDPADVLRQAYAKLQPGGLLVVRTSNYRCSLFARNPSKWWAFGIDHRFYFSIASLTAAMRHAGFTVRETLNLEPIERPDKPPTSLTANPRHWLRHALGRWRYGRHYHTSLMTVIASKPTT